MSKLGVFWSVMHRRPQDYAFFKAQQPTVFKILDGGPPDYQWARDNLPNSLVIARDWALSEQHADMLKDPIGTGIRHAREWNEHQKRLGFSKAKTLILGINEPHVWEPGVPEALRQYTIMLCGEATLLGLRVGAMQLSVGWPNNDGPDTPPNWAAWHGVDNAIRANNGALVVHEYWADNGPGENWGWWAGRVLKCPWQVPIVVGEAGIDMYVKDGSVQHLSRGWRGRKSPEQYAAELADYTERMSADGRFVGNAVFAADFANGEWASFDIEPAYNAILATPVRVVTPAPPSTGTQPTATVAHPDGVNVRSGPGVHYAKLGAEPHGAVMPIVGRNEGGSWWLVELPHIQGWVANAIVAASNTANVPVVDMDETQEPTPAPDQPPQPPSGDKWQRSIEWVLQWEGGYQNVANDKGNWTGCEVGKGENKGTNYGISACSYPNLDIRALTLDEARAIYERDYWQASGASALDYPLCLLVLDTAVLHGVGTAKKWLAETGTDPYAFAAKRLHTYTKLDNWDFWGKGWVNRTADLLEEMSA